MRKVYSDSQVDSAFSEASPLRQVAELDETDSNRVLCSVLELQGIMGDHTPLLGKTRQELIDLQVQLTSKLLGRI